MKVTNVLGLPQAFVEAVSVERHNAKGSYSATTLLHSATDTLLTERHWEEIEVDASDSVWAVWGTAVHSIFEKQKDNSFKEEKFSVKVGNSTVTGRVDNYDMENEILADFKTCASWKIIYKDFDDWYKQGMIYAWLMKQSGLNVKRCQFIALIKDHSKSKAKTDASYPQSPVYVYQFDITESALAEIEDFIKTRIADLEANENTPDNELKGCTPEERWSKGDSWAIMRTGRKTALKVCKSEEEANALLKELGGDSIEFRKGEDVRCESYCNVCKWCPYYQKQKVDNK
jgi:hypothetical protein